MFTSLILVPVYSCLTFLWCQSSSMSNFKRKFRFVARWRENEVGRLFSEVLMILDWFYSWLRRGTPRSGLKKKMRRHHCLPKCATRNLSSLVSLKRVIIIFKHADRYNTWSKHTVLFILIAHFLFSIHRAHCQLTRWRTIKASQRRRSY